MGPDQSGLGSRDRESGYTFCTYTCLAGARVTVGRQVGSRYLRTLGTYPAHVLTYFVGKVGTRSRWRQYLHLCTRTIPIFYLEDRVPYPWPIG